MFSTTSTISTTSFFPSPSSSFSPSLSLPFFKVFEQDPEYRRQFCYTEDESLNREPIFFIDLEDDTSGLFVRDDIFWVETDLKKVTRNKSAGEMSAQVVKMALDELLFSTLKVTILSSFSSFNNKNKNKNKIDIPSQILSSPQNILADYNALVDVDHASDTSFLFDVFHLSSNREMLKLWIKMQS